MNLLRVLLVFIAISIFSTSNLQTTAAQNSTAADLAGLWEAKSRFGPDVRGTLSIRQTGGRWRADIAGYSADTTLEGNNISFVLPDGKNSFRGKFDVRHTRITGHWIQEPTMEGGSKYASPVTLTKYGLSEWRGDVLPLDSTMTNFLMIKKRDDGSVGVFLVNKERNIGVYRQYRFDHLEREDDKVKFFAADTEKAKGQMLIEGSYNKDTEVLSLYFPNRGGSFDFRRIAVNQASDFYPRGLPNAPYSYTPPPALDDGWPTGSLEEVGISGPQIEKFIRTIIDTPIESPHSHELHGILIARHGKLVLEEYFHGENREKPHDTRSAGKSLTSTLIGAAINSGVPLKISSPVYQVMNGGKFPDGLDPRKRAMTLEHLLTMSSGFEADDSDPNSKNENYMLDESPEPDYYKFTLGLNMVREPGELSMYTSVSPNLAGGVLQRAAGKPLPGLMQELLADPLQIKHYYMPLAPNGDAYMGGGVRFRPRDFMKLGQLYVNGGTWNGHRILSAEWCKRATSRLYQIGGSKPIEPALSTGYGYLWWTAEYNFRGKTIKAFYAAGNGGQTVMGIPELDLVVAFYAGNYADSPGLVIQQTYVPKYILPAIIDNAR